MKNIITTAIALFLGVFVFAQNEITVSGTVSSTEGIPVEGVQVNISTDSLTNGGPIFAVAFTDASGHYTLSFSLDEADAQGLVYASISDCDQNLLFGNSTWNLANTEVVIDFTYCGIQGACQAYAFPEWQTNTISAVMTGTPPFTYLWGNGADTQSIEPDGSGLYCVTITDVGGCTASACYDAANGGTDSSCLVVLYPLETNEGLMIEAQPYGLGNITYSWNTGATSSSILATAPGTYCVTTTDAEGCEATACTNYFPDPCEVAIEINAAGTQLQAISAGEAPFTFSWNTGSTLASTDIDPNVNFYSVTVTDANGCQSTAAYWYQGGVDTCSVEIIPLQNGTALEAAVNGAGPVTYAWSTGETTAVLQDVEPGYYCVTITTDSGCSSSDCIFIENPNAPYIIDGYVYLPDSLNGGTLEGWAYLIVYDEAEGTLTAVDTTELENFPSGGAAYYQFDAQPAGDYLIKAALEPGTNGYEEHVPTYYGNVLWWDEANTVTLPFNGWGTFNLTLIPGDNPGGPGFIGGYVADGANLQPGEIEVRDDEPMAGVSIILLDEQEQPLGYTYTDSNGEFFFPSLAYGTYKVVIEHAGYEQQHYWVTLTQENPGTEGLYFEVGEDGITDTGQLVAEAGMALFPNPATSTLQVVLTDVQGLGAIQVWNAQGQVVLSRESVDLGGTTTSLDVSTLPAGIYYLQMMAEGQSVTQKWMKQ